MKCFQMVSVELENRDRVKWSWCKNGDWKREDLFNWLENSSFGKQHWAPFSNEEKSEKKKKMFLKYSSVEMECEHGRKIW